MIENFHGKLGLYKTLLRQEPTEATLTARSNAAQRLNIRVKSRLLGESSRY